MFIKHYGSTISLMISVEICQFMHDTIMVPNIKPERKAMRVSIQILTNFPVKSVKLTAGGHIHSCLGD